MNKTVPKVLVIAPTPFFADRGCHVHILEQALALQGQGHEVLVVTYGQGRDYPGVKIRRTLKFPWYTKETVGPTWHKFYVDIFLLFTAIKAARSFQPDIIHAHLHEGCLIGFILKRIFGLGLVFDCQGSLTGELIAHNFPLVKGAWLRRQWYKLEKWLDSLPDAVLAQSTEMRQELIAQFQVEARKIFMAYDGVNVRSFMPSLNKKSVLKKLGIPAHRKIIVYLGGLSPHKGAMSLLQSFRQVNRQVPDAHLVLMGYPNENDYRRAAHRLGVADFVSITGRVNYEDAPELLSIGDVAVAPKRTQTEANGKIYNYMAAGLPIVAFDTVVNRDILGNLGVLVSPHQNEEGLAEGIIYLLQDDQLRRDLAAQAREKAISQYSWDNVARRIAKAYRYAYQPWQFQDFAVSIKKK